MAANIELNQTEKELKREWKASRENKKDGVNKLLQTVGHIMTGSVEMKGDVEVQKSVSKRCQCILGSGSRECSKKQID